MDRSADIAIVGAGIVGLAHAYMSLRKGYRVVLFDRDQFAVGASVRNFGLLWTIGQEPGVGLERALRSRNHWQDVAKDAGLWINNNGSLHVVYNDDELTILEEFLQLYDDSSYQCRFL
jgi:glycine/D-amino acid oxidase-like deaminating enzyme